MIALFRTLSLRSWRERLARALLVVASIALGVATLVATRVLNESMWVAVRTATNPLSFADLYVTNGESGVRADLVDYLRALPGVRDVEPLVTGRVRLPDLGDHRHAQFLGLVWRADSEEKNPWGVRIHWTIAPGNLPGVKGADPQALLTRLKRWSLRPLLAGKDLEAELHASHGDASLERMLQWIPKALAEELKTSIVRVQPVGREPEIFIKVGTVEADGPAGDLIKNTLILNASDAAELKGQPDLFSRLDLFLQPGTDREAMRRQVESVLDGGAAVRTADENEQRAQEIMAGMQLGFSLTGAGALVVGLFLVYIVLAVTVAERRHEIGILRSLGATRGQVWTLFVGEAAFQGLFGAALGIPFGIGMAYECQDFIKNLLSDVVVQLEAPGIQIHPATLIVAATAGVITALIAALVPAVRAAQEEPAHAVKRVPQIPGFSHQVLQLTISATLLTLGAAVMILRNRPLLQNYLPPRAGTYGGFVLVLVGLLLTTPPLAAWAARGLQPLARWLMGLEGRLASDNLIRVPGRTGLVITVLTAGVAIFLQTAGVIRSNQEPFLDWVDRSEDADLFITSGSMVTGTGQNLLMEKSLGQTIQEQIPEAAVVLPVRTRQADFGKNMVYLIAVDAAGFAAADHVQGPLMDQALYRRLLEPGPARAIVSKNFAALYGIKVNDVIQLRGPHGLIPLQVAGKVVDYTFPRGTVLIDHHTYQQHFDDPLVDEFYVYLKPGARDRIESVRQEILRRWEAEHALVVTTWAENHEHMARLLERFSLVAYSQEVVVGLVAALGVMFALLISVLQRRRELGILRAMGATQGQILFSVLAEAILMGIIGAVIGLVVGVAIEWYCVHVILFEEAGFLFPVLIPWREAGLIAGGAMLVATLAGLGPAIRTMHLRIPEAIAYE
jgi:putative ABC transport system permease protein